MNHRHLAPWVAALIMLVACPPPDKQESGSDRLAALPADYGAKAEAQLRNTWSVYVAAHPDLLKQLLQAPPARGGWVKFYNRDYPAALEAFQGVTTEGGRIGLGRAHLALAEFYERVFELALEAERKYLTMWDENASRVPKTACFDFVAGVNAFHRGDQQAAIHALDRYLSAGDGVQERLAAVASVLRGAALRRKGDAPGAARAWADPRIARFPEAGWLLFGLTAGKDAQSVGVQVRAPASPATDDPYARRSRAFALAARGEVDQAERILASTDPKAPDFEEIVRLTHGSVVRRYHDPLVLHTLALVHAGKALEVLEAIPGAKVYRARARRITGDQAADPGGVPETIDARTLPLFLFSEYPTPADMDRAASMLEGREGRETGLFWTFHTTLGAVAQGDETGEDMRMVVALAQKYVDIGRRIVRGTGNEVGTKTVLGLKTVEADIDRAVRRRAERLAAGARWIDALFLFEHVMEKGEDGFTYRNEPLLFVEVTNAYVALGRYREAMNYFYRLVERYPELWLVQEALGNPSILGTVDQAGRNGQQD